MSGAVVGFFLFRALLVAKFETPDIFLKPIASRSRVVGLVASSREISNLKCRILVELRVAVEEENSVSILVVNIDPSGRIGKGV